ncbi:PIG-L deacetylase family protein [Gracilibacillus dipsosauri]|uniref:PIG-L deacetylase family protein n=1 Tax=Gracilibacillus dipsosauri TaxID=178340 RepID=UPI00240A5DF7
MKVKQFIMTILRPINIPITNAILKRHYHRNMELSNTKGAKRVLVFAPHMDDETIGPGGVIRKHALEGAEVHCVFVTDGSNSVSNLSKEELIRARMQEMEEVKDILGIHDIKYLGLPDGNVTNNEESRKLFLEVIQSVQPDMVYCTSFVDAHPDHTETANILADILKENEELDCTLRLYEINCPIPPDFINCIVDISDTWKDKARAMDVFSSQAIAFDGFLTLNRLKANLLEEKVHAVEVFVEPSRDQFIRHCEKLRSKKETFPTAFKQANRTDTLLWAIYHHLKYKLSLYEESQLKN